MTTLLDDIQNRNIPVSDLLRRVKVMAKNSNDTDFLKWVDLELNGYAEDSSYPEYRKVRGEVMALNPYRGWQPVIFATSEIEAKISTCPTKQSVGEIEELLRVHTGKYEIPYAASTAAKIIAGSPFEGTKVSLFFDSAPLMRVLNAVRNSLLDWALASEVSNTQHDSAVEVALPIDSKLKPRLGTKQIGRRTVGYLWLNEVDEPCEIADVDSRQFMLVRCLFNSENDIKKNYEPRFQTYDRVYEAIRLPKDAQNTRLLDTATKDSEMRAIIEYAIKEIQKKKKISRYLKFEMEEGRMRLRITLPEGDEE